ncbi:DNA-binding protein, partial [Salmonella enterica subsp. enterica serovar Tennessee]|nr:DNA-binding protein [Salmonella enterica subsp. enterica serovar Tennessee]ECS5835226.1 DNA-binding protein [Salmonella enterica subsp. enterica serovar Tennessee]EDE4574350.1 DNA-binding protein [Salmonella enterica subsp. enterica serovar Montevideo]MLD78849.1 DNA-binding protein [Salmonella enterica]
MPSRAQLTNLAQSRFSFIGVTMESHSLTLDEA